MAISLFFSLSQCLRHAYMSGAGYGDCDKISEEDQRRWASYEMPSVSSFERIVKALEAADKAEQFSRTDLTFGEALTALKEGRRVTRKEWESSDSIAVLEIIYMDFHAPYFRIGHFEYGDEPFYVIDGPGLEDIMADDWIVLPRADRKE